MSGSISQRFSDYGLMTGRFAQTLGRGGVMRSNYGQKLLLVAVQTGKGNICFTNPFLLKMGCEISGWRFLKFGSFMRGFTVFAVEA